MPFFVLCATKSANVVVVTEGDGPKAPGPESVKSCRLYDIRHEINADAEETADAGGDPSAILKPIDVDRAAMEMLFMIEDERGQIDPAGTAFATLSDVWKWIRERQSLDLE